MADAINRDKPRLYAARQTRIERERRCWELHLRRWTQTEIAHELAIHQSQVNRYIAKSKGRLDQDLTDLVCAYKTDQLDKLGLILGEALKAWQVSVSKNKPNVKFLTEARGALKDVRDLLGLNAPVETIVNLTPEQAAAELDAEDEPKGPDAG